MKKKKLSFVIPIYNEGEIIPELYRRIIAVLKQDFPELDYEIILVDDGSSDDSFGQMKLLRNNDKNVKCIQFSRNFGHHIAISAGLDYAIGDYVVMMDGDLQDKPEEVIKLYRKLLLGYDVVFAERMNKQFNFLKKFTSKIFNLFIRHMVHEDIVINSTIFRIMTKQVTDSIKQLRESNRYLIGIVGWVGYRQTVQKVEHGRRFKGKTKYNFSKQLDLAVNAIFSYSDYPMRFIIKLGLFFVFISVIMIVIIVIRKFIYHTPVLGWTSLITVSLVIGGIQIIILGIIGSYIGRSYMENKNRPLYIAREVLL